MAGTDSDPSVIDYVLELPAVGNQKL